MKPSFAQTGLLESSAGEAICLAPGWSSIGGAATGEGRCASNGSSSCGEEVMAGLWLTEGFSVSDRLLCE